MSSIDDLAALIARHVPGIGIHRTALPNVSLALALAPTMPMPTLYKPSVCIVASGSKRVELGKTGYVYDGATFLPVSVDLPVTGAVLEASSDRPFQCLRLDVEVGVGVLCELVLD